MNTPLCPRALLQALPEAVVVLDAAGAVRDANDAAVEWLGASRDVLLAASAEEWAALLGRRVVGPARGVPLAFCRALSERVTGRGYPSRVYQRDVRPVASDGSPAGWLEVFRDVTDHVKAEEERERLLAQHAREIAGLETRLEQIDRYKTELTANVSHDLRTPLASIKASVSGLLAGDVTIDSQVLRETLTVIEEETDRLQRRVQNLLSMSRMEAGDAPLSRDWLDPADVAASAIESLRSIQGTHEIRRDFADDLPMINADYDQLQIAVRNLIENALIYSPPGTPVEVSVRQGLQSLQFRVRDWGQGLMPDEFERVFDKFYRGRSARRIPGTGLGLPICRGIAEAHGGRLWAEHAPGGGVAFVLSLPVEEEPPAVEQT